MECDFESELISDKLKKKQQEVGIGRYDLHVTAINLLL